MRHFGLGSATLGLSNPLAALSEIQTLLRQVLVELRTGPRP